MKFKPWLKSWPAGVPEKIDYPNIPLFQILQSSAKKYPHHDALIFNGKKITYNELDLFSDKFATFLFSLGVKKGDCVAIFLPNSPQFVISYYGILKVGAFVTAIDPLSKKREIEFQINNSGAKILVCLDLFYSSIKNVKQKTTVETIIVTNAKDFFPLMKKIIGVSLRKMHNVKIPKDFGISFRRFLNCSNHRPDVDLKPKKDLALIQYSGGTTGRPKGVMLTHYNLLSNAIMCAKWFQGKETKDVVLAVLPLSHIYGMTTSMNATIYLADTLILLGHPNLIQIMKSIQKFHTSILCGVPTVYSKLVAHPYVTTYNLKSLRYCISGAFPLSAKVQKKFMELTGGILVEGYGLTEASPVTHSNPLDFTMKTVKIGSIGIPWPDTDVKIVDLETGKAIVPKGNVGELVIKGPQVMKGYWKSPEETKKVIKEGWVYTGDIAKMDDQGYFYILDRKKDVIKYKGYSIFPGELEEIVNEHPLVKSCAVIGKPCPIVGEIPKAFIVLKKEGSVSAQEIMKFVEEKVSNYKSIREVEFRKELPINRMGKVLRKKLSDERIKR